MPIAVTCQCGRVMSAPDSTAGRKARCKGCGAILVIPVADAQTPIPFAFTPDDAPPPDDTGPVSIPGLKTDAPGLASDDDGDGDAKGRAPTAVRDPWYYDGLDLVAMLLIGLALVIALFGVLGAFGMFVMTMVWADGPSYGGTLGLLLPLGIPLYAVAAALPSLVAGMLLKLALDAARSLRAIRHRPAE